MDRKSPSIGVQLVEIKDLDHKDVKVPDHKIYLVHCLADPKPGNEFGWVDPIPVYAIVSLSLEKFQVESAIRKENDKVLCQYQK